MPSASPPFTATAASTPRERFARRPLWFDRIVIIALGACGSVLSFNALRQVAVAIHTTPTLSFLFPLVVDGFIAYGVRAILVLRDAPLGARLYAWTLFGAATTASLWANALHAVRLNRPGIHILILGNHTVAILSAIAPLALGGATHLHILVTRNAARRPAAAETIPRAAETASAVPAVPAAQPANPHADTNPARLQAPAEPAPESGHTAKLEAAADSAPEPATSHNADRSGTDDSDRRSGTARGGRRAEASIDQLAAIIASEYPGPGQPSRAQARDAIKAHDLSAGNDRTAQALQRLQDRDEARPHPSAD